MLGYFLFVESIYIYSDLSVIPDIIQNNPPMIILPCWRAIDCPFLLF